MPVMSLKRVSWNIVFVRLDVIMKKDYLLNLPVMQPWSIQHNHHHKETQLRTLFKTSYNRPEICTKERENRDWFAVVCSL